MIMNKTAAKTSFILLFLIYFCSVCRGQFVYSVSVADENENCINIPESTCTPCVSNGITNYLIYNESNYIGDKLENIFIFSTPDCSGNFYSSNKYYDANVQCECIPYCNPCYQTISVPIGFNGYSLSLTSSYPIFVNVSQIDNSDSFRFLRISSFVVNLYGVLDKVIIESNGVYFYYERHISSTQYTTSVGGPYNYGDAYTFGPLYFSVYPSYVNIPTIPQIVNNTFQFSQFTGIAVDSSSSNTFSALVIGYSALYPLIEVYTNDYDLGGLVMINEDYSAAEMNFVPAENAMYEDVLVSKIVTPDHKYGDPFITINCTTLYRGPLSCPFPYIPMAD